MELLERFDEEEVDGKPNRAAPVGIPAEQACLSLARLIIHPVRCRADLEFVGVLAMELAERADAERAQKFTRVQHPLKQVFHPLLGHQSDQAPVSHAE